MLVAEQHFLLLRRDDGNRVAESLASAGVIGIHPTRALGVVPLADEKGTVSKRELKRRIEEIPAAVATGSAS